MSKMFDCITATWNVVTGCKHGCIYCGARMLAEGKLANTKKWKNRKFDFPMIHKWEFKRKFKPDTMVFVSDMGDLFGQWVPTEWIEHVLNYIKQFSKTSFLLLTKNPRRYIEFTSGSWTIAQIPENCIIGVTVESDIDFGVTNAPAPRNRLQDFAEIKYPRKMVSIEPIIKFNLIYLTEAIRRIKPLFVYIGFDNYNHHLQEPSIDEVDKLVAELAKFTEVRLKDSINKRRNKSERRNNEISERTSIST